MTKQELKYVLLALFTLSIALGYGTLAHAFFTQIVARADFETMGFPFIIASNTSSRTAIIMIATAMSIGSSIVLSSQLASSILEYNDYLQRLLNQMPEKHQEKNRQSNGRIYGKRQNGSNLPDPWRKE